MGKWKVFLTIIVLLFAAGGSALYYFQNVKEYKTADPKIDNVIKNNYKIILPVANQKDHATKQTRGMEASDKVGKQAPQSRKSSLSTAVRLEKHTVVGQKETSSDIIAKYLPAFKSLEDQANSRLDSLLSDAFNEYQAKKAEGGTISYFYFYSKYSGAAKALEANTDASFNIIYDGLVKSLEQAGYSEDEATPIKNQYLSLKKQRKSEILAKAMANLK